MQERTNGRPYSVGSPARAGDGLVPPRHGVRIENAHRRAVRSVKTGDRNAPVRVRGRPCMIALASMVFAAGCAPPPPDASVEFRIPVEVDDVGTDTVEDLVVATGNLRPTELVTLDIETPGHLNVARNAEGRRLAEGMRVSAGDIIARVTGEDARLHARLDSTRQALKAAEAHLERRRELHDANLASEEELQQAEERYETALYSFERSELDAEKATLTTPIDGTILRLARDNDGRPQADGQLVRAGFKVAEIAPLDELIADIDLIGPELARVEVGLAARIHHYAFDDETFVGEVVRISPSLDPVRHTFRAEVSVDNAAGILKPGMFVEVTVVVERRVDVVVVSRDAVANRAGKSVVFVLNGQRVSRRAVRLGLGDDDKVQIIEGLAAGDRVAVRGLETLNDDTRVREVGS